MACSKTPPQALKNISLKQNKPFKGGLPYPLSRKMAAEFVVSVEVDGWKPLPSRCVMEK